MQNMGIKEKQGYKTFCDVMFVLLCVAIVIGIIALGIWISVTYLGFTW
ncbi:MAG: sarcoglycan [Roseburia sp.]|nr:sarcoglycan [Roseburia sp.]MCM1556305.1 sarcoglycan [Anaeroplasma bactoclasticum]